MVIFGLTIARSHGMMRTRLAPAHAALRSERPHLSDV
jgi:hypothetical protein